MRGATKPSSRLALLVVSGLLVCAGVGVAAPVAADPARVEMNVSAARLSEGDALTVEVIASGDYERIDAPVSEGFDFQQTGRSSQVSIMGSQVQRSERLSYSATPRRRGRWRIQGARLLGGGQVIASAGDIEIEVVDARESLGPAVDPTQAGKIENFVGEAFFVRPEMLIAKPYVGQQAVLSFQLFWTRNQNVNHLSEISEPNYGELHVEDLLAGKTTEHEAVRFGGAPYLRQLTRQVLLSSPKAGVFEVVGPRYRVDVTNFFDSRTFKVGPPPLRIEVRPLPSEGRPASFAAGAVGKLALRGWLLERGREVTRTKLSTGERGVIAYEVAGNGNLYGIGEIAPPALDHMFVERLPDDRDVQVQIDANGPHGRRIWQHTVSFDAPGTYVIPARAFAAFDPFEERYVETSAEALTIEVEGAPLQGATVAPADPASAEAAAAAAAALGEPSDGAPTVGAGGAPGQPGAGGGTSGTASKPGAAAPVALRPLAANAGLQSAAHAPLAATTWFWPAALAPWCLALLALLASALRRRRDALRPGLTQDQALATAIAEIEASLGGSDGSAVLRSAIDRYLQTRAGLASAGMTYAAFRAALVAQGPSADDVTLLVQQLERCDTARFAPSGDAAGDLRQAASTLVEVLPRIDAALVAARAAADASRARRRGGASGAVVIAMATASLCAPTRPALAATLEDAFAAANAAALRGDNREAQRGYEDLLTHQQDTAAIHYNLGNVLLRQDQLGAATAHYRHAIGLVEEPALRADIEANLALTRDRLAEASRRRHRILHVFDESPELGVALARAAPLDALAILALTFGWGALLLMLLWREGLASWGRRATLATLVTLHLICVGWLWQARATLAAVRTAVVVAADAPLEACSGVAEPIELPEGLEVRVLRERPDGRREVRLPNGRTGCVEAPALYHLPGA